MKVVICAFAISALLVSGAVASQSVMAKQDNTPVYSSSDQRLNEPIFSVSSREALTVEGQKWSYYKVTDSQGRSGWIKKSECREVKSSSHLVLDDLVVEAYGDNPYSSIVFGTSPEDQVEIKLERSFKEALLCNVDRETLERMDK